MKVYEDTQTRENKIIKLVKGIIHRPFHVYRGILTLSPC